MMERIGDRLGEYREKYGAEVDMAVRRRAAEDVGGLDIDQDKRIKNLLEVNRRMVEVYEMMDSGDLVYGKEGLVGRETEKPVVTASFHSYFLNRGEGNAA